MLDLKQHVQKSLGSRRFGDAKKDFTEEISKQFQSLTFKEIIEDDYFLGKFGKALFPKNRELLEYIWDAPDRWFDEFIYVAGIGGGKTTLAGVNIWMMVFRSLSLWQEPQDFYGLMPDSTIAFSVMSRTADLAKRVTFHDLIKYFQVPVFNDYFPTHTDLVKVMDNPKKLPRELRFSRRLVIFPGTGSALSQLGYNLHSSIVDEVNRIMERQEVRSDVAVDSTPADEAVDSIKKRMESRFMKAGGGAKGLLSITSSPWSASDYTKKRILEAIKVGEKTARVFWFWDAIWNIKPETAFSGEKFWFDVEKLKIIDSWKQTIPVPCKACNKEVTEGFILVTPEENMKICSIDCYKAMKNAPVERIGF